MPESGLASEEACQAAFRGLRRGQTRPHADETGGAGQQFRSGDDPCYLTLVPGVGVLLRVPDHLAPAVRLFQDYSFRPIRFGRSARGSDRSRDRPGWLWCWLNISRPFRTAQNGPTFVTTNSDTL